MEAYKFETIVLEDGKIQIPEIARFANRPVEIFIVIKQIEPLETEQAQTIDRFLAKWTGFLKGVNPDELKLQYIQEKYA